MKKTKTLKAPTEAYESSARMTVLPGITQQTANALFVKSLGKVADGANEHPVKQFLHVATQVIENSTSFSIFDVLYHMRPLNLDSESVKKLFLLWSAKMVELGKLKRVEGCYDYSIFTSVIK
jgi:hypothetical protein